MRQSLTWFWQRGILSTFLAGLFALLPIVITLGIMAWAGGRATLSKPDLFLLPAGLGPYTLTPEPGSRATMMWVNPKPDRDHP